MNGLPNTNNLTEKQINSFVGRIKKENNGCWLWTGGLTNIGYGKFGVKNKTLMAHRVSYELFKGKIPDGLVLDHFFCKTRNCVNYEHMEPVTQAENVRRGKSFGSVNSKKTECPKGHAYDKDNTRFETLKTGTVVRHCRKCNVEAVARKKEENLAKWYQELRAEFNMPSNWPYSR